MIWHSGSFDTMKEAFDNKANSASRENGEDDPEELVLPGLPKCVKVTLVMTVFGPQLYILITLLVAGCRWLCATADLTDLLLNALALEFVLNVKDLLYNVL